MIHFGRILALYPKPRAVPEPHKHVFDSDNGWVTWQGYPFLECRCGAWGPLSPDELLELIRRQV